MYLFLSVCVYPACLLNRCSRLLDRWEYASQTTPNFCWLCCYRFFSQRCNLVWMPNLRYQSMLSLFCHPLTWVSFWALIDSKVAWVNKNIVPTLVCFDFVFFARERYWLKKSNILVFVTISENFNHSFWPLIVMMCL